MTHFPPNLPLDRFSLGPWQVTLSRDEVTGQGQVHKLEPRTMRLLAVLAEADGEVVPAATLLTAVWPGVIVTPSSLYDAIAQLREVLGPEHIATVARKGYRLATPTRPLASPAPVIEIDRIGGELNHLEDPRLGPRSVAVLPFGAQGLPESLSFLSESLTGGLISELSRQPDLVVVARGTMLTFGTRRASPSQVARELGARFVVDGQLEQRADTLHVSVQVVDGWRGTQTWGDTLELPANAWHETATVVVGRLARALRLELNDLASRAPVAASDAEVQARAFAAQAWVQLFARAQTPTTNERATTLANQARALAPQLAQTWMCLAYSDWRAGYYRWNAESRDALLARALTEAERAVELDPRDPDAHYVLGLATRHGGQRPRSEEAFRHCLRLATSYAPAHGQLAQACVRRGDVETARAHCDRAFALSPLEPLRVIWHAALAEAFLVLDDPRSALEEAQRGMAVNPAYPQVFLLGTAAAWRLGEREQAREWVATLREHESFSNLATVREALMTTYDPAALEQFEQLIASLRAAGLPEN